MRDLRCFHPWYRATVAAHARALAAPMPGCTRYRGESHQRDAVEQRYLEHMMRQIRANGGAADDETSER